MWILLDNLLWTVPTFLERWVGPLNEMRLRWLDSDGSRLDGWWGRP